MLIRQGLKNFHSPLSKSDLFKLAQKDHVESRLIRENRGNYNLDFGPFEISELNTLPKKKCTLLIQDVDKLLSKVADFRKMIEFLPSWTFEDIMVSYAVDGGSVGPHVDRYSVFLLQATGKRHWQIDCSERPDMTLRKNQSLRILQNFTASDSWVLEPGDVLYLPPYIPHHGVAVGECTTWSFGFRAPNKRELFLDYFEQCSREIEHDVLYQFSDQGKGQPTGLLPEKLNRDLSSQLKKLIDSSHSQGILGQILSRPKDPSTQKLLKPLDRNFFKIGQTLRVRLNIAVRAYYLQRGKLVTVFINGEAVEFGNQGKAAKSLCEGERTFSGIIKNKVLLAALLELNELGFLEKVT